MRLPDVPLHAHEYRIAPQPGPQTQFLRCVADCAVFGGSAFGGKSFALILDPSRFAALAPVPDFGAVIFRRTSPQITQQGGLWDESGRWYPLMGGVSNQTRLEWSWPKYRTRIRFAHMQYASDRFNWQGAQIPYIGFDELTHFDEEAFFYLWSRNRSMCGVKPRIRATTNPDADSWVKRFLAPWVDETYSEPAQSGEIRYFLRIGGQIEWLPKGTRHPDAKSVTFIRSSIFDNQIGLAKNPEYLTSLKALPLVERQRLLYGDWSIRPSGNLFRREWFAGRILDAAPASFERIVRYWDFAATEEGASADPDYTVGVKLGRKDGIFYVLDVQRARLTPANVEALVCATAALDGKKTRIWVEQEPGSSGVATVARYKRLLAGYSVSGNRATGSKTERAAPVSSQAEAGNISLLRGPWNEAYINELVAFPTRGVHDDQVDATSGAFDRLVAQTGGGLVALPASETDLTETQWW